MISKLKNIIKFLLYSFISFLVLSNKTQNKGTLLLIRLDAIGDYVLFRNFIEVLKKSEEFNGFKITLLGNCSWKGLSEELDNEHVDEFIWLDRNKYNKDFFYRYKKLKEIASNSYEVVLSPLYSREFFVGDAIVNLVHADKKIGSSGDNSNISIWQKKISDNYYTNLISAKNGTMFEFNRNKEFFENLLNVKLDITKPYISLKLKKLNFYLPKKYAILFIGAGKNYRKWSIEKFAKIGEYLKERYEYEIVLCGGQSDADDALKFNFFFSGNYVDLVGKTSLIELLHVIYKGDLMIANETSAPHIAVALNMKSVVVISNGNHYRRFTPYPKEVSENYHVILHPKIGDNLDYYKKLSNSYGFESDLDINEINLESVKGTLDGILI